MSSHEFNHWFYKDSWSRIVRRWRLTPSQRSRAKGLWLTFGSRYVVEEKIPKRETALEEGVLEHEDFWGLYVVEKLSVFRLVIYSLAFLSPSVYFFFAWLFEWGHGGDLQNASVPIALSLAPLATFWGFVLSTSHGSGSPRVSWVSLYLPPIQPSTLPIPESTTCDDVILQLLLSFIQQVERSVATVIIWLPRSKAKRRNVKPYSGEFRLGNM